MSHRIQRGLELIRKWLHREGLYAGAIHLGRLLESQTPPALPLVAGRGIGKVLISASATPAASSLVYLTNGGLSMLAKLAIAALLVVTPYAIWKTSSPGPDQPAEAIAPAPSRPAPPAAVPAAETSNPVETPTRTLIAANETDRKSVV